ncbi:MAG: EAL domain-containing protein [Rhodocyclales bacterium]|nr:EAL domain-containing protein [Rhodocyclales bacterium]
MPDIDPCRILLVEDDPGDAHLVRQLLRAASEPRFEVVWVEDFASAQEKLSREPPHVLLLDLSLPDSNGIDTVLAGRRAAGPLPLIVLTGRDDTHFALQALEAGAQDYLLKGSFDADALVRAIRYAISRARLEQSLAETSTHLRTLIDAIPDSVFFKDGDGRWLEANNNGLKLFGLEHTAYHGMTDEDLAASGSFFSEAFLACQASDEAAWRAGGICRVEEAVSAPEGPPQVFDVIKVPLFHDDGRRKGLVVVGRNVTERKLAEARLRLSARVFETAGEAILVTDADAAIVAVNPAFSRITGYAEAEVIGKNPSLFSSGRHDKAFFRDMWQSLTSVGSWSGEIWNRRKNGEIYPEWLSASCIRDGDGRITQYVGVFADLSEIRSAQETAEILSWRDALTGLANRAFFLTQLEKALVGAKRENRIAVLMLIDLDRFKDINEARGLTVGDALLKTVAVHLAQSLHADDVLARLDSDEFAVLLPRLVATREAAGREALAVAEKLRGVLRSRIALDGEVFHLDASIGIALFPEEPGEGGTDILRQADTAMHLAKDAGGGGAVFFETAMGETVRQRYELERELRAAVAEGQLRLYLQPQVDAGGRQVGAEALVRWQHPERGLIPPAVFIAMAETSDLIVAVDRWMLANVCRLLAQLDADGRTLRIAVNISPRHFQKPDFVEVVKQQLAVSGADPTHLVLEVTEGLVIGDIADVVAKMTALTTLGIHFSMDDFGTGYSSLAYLKRLPIHELKIDKSFVQDAPSDPNDAALVETILAVAQHLHLKVVAEGVEVAEQAAFLNARGDVVHQGYLFGRPQPVEAWLALVRSQA